MKPIKHLGSRALILICLAAGLFAKAQVPNFQWARAIGAIDINSIISSNAIATDTQGNVYTAGYFIGTPDFDPGPGIFTLTAAPQQAFICKLDASGNFVWAKTFATTAAAWAMALDANGNIYVAGNFVAGAADFDPGAGIYSLSGPGAYILKLDPAGNFVWAKGLGGSNTYIFSVAIDTNFNVYSAGSFSNNAADFDPGPATYTLASSGDDIFISKLDVSGNFVWARQIGGVLSQYASAVVTDATGDLYFSGTFYGTVDFDPGAGNYPLISPSFTATAYVCKLSSAGNFIWAVCPQGPGLSNGGILARDKAGNIYSAGIFANTVDFDPGPGSYPLSSIAGSRDIYISKLGPAGNMVWTKTMGGPDMDVPKSMAVDTTGDVYITGFFQISADFDPGPGTYSLASLCPNNVFSPSDAFVCKLTAVGNFGWARVTAPTCESYAYGITVDASDAVYTTGQFTGSGNFNTDPGGVSTLTNNCQISGFVHKMSQSNVVTGGISQQVPVRRLNVYPNPANDLLYIEGDVTVGKILEVRVYNSLGQLIETPTIDTEQTQLDVHLLKSGIYFIQARDNNGSLIRKFVKE